MSCETEDAALLREQLRQARAELAEARAETDRLRQLLDGLIDLNPLAIGITDAEGYPLRGNRAVKRYFRRAQLPQHPFFEEPVFRRHFTDEDFDRLRRGECALRRELRFDRRELDPEAGDGQVDIDAVVFPLLDAAGAVRHFAMLIDDIGDRRRAEEEVKARDVFIRTLVDNLPFDMYAMDINGRYTMQNATSRRNWGDVVGKRVADLGLPPEVEARWRAEDARVLRGEVVRSEYSATVAGEDRVVESVIAPLMGDREIRGVIGVTMDVTERKRAVAELEARVDERTRELREACDRLRASEERLREVMDASRDIFFHVDLRDERIIYLSPACERITGYPVEQVVEAGLRFVWSRTHPDDLKALQHPPLPADEVRAGVREKLNETEFRVRSREGRYLWLRGWRTVRYDEHGQPVAAIGVHRDVTVRKAAEEGLELMRRTLDRTEVSVFWVSPDGRIRYANDAASRTLGYSSGELLRMKVEELNPELDGPAWAAWVERLKSYGAMTMERQMQARDGRIIPIEIHADYIRFRGEDYVFAFIQDIAERKRTEEDLQQALATLEQRVRERTAELEAEREHFRSLMRHAEGFAIFRLAVDPDNRLDTGIVFVSDSLDRMLGGVDLNDFPAWHANIHPEDREVMLRASREAIVEARHFEQEFRVVLAEDTRWLRTISVPVLDEAGRATYYNGIILDITEAKRAEAEIQKSRANLLALVENLDGYILFCDNEGKPIIFNSAYAGMIEFALGVKMRPGLKPHTLIPDPQERVRWDEYHRRVLAGERFRIEFTHEFAPGDVRYFEFSYNPVVQDGNIVGFSEFSRDITARKEAEKALIRAERLAAVGTLASGVAHEFNNLHQVILGWTQMLEMDAEISASARTAIDRILNASKRAASITENLLVYTRRRLGTHAGASLSQVVLETLDLVRREYESDGVEFRLRLASVPESVMDTGAVGQVAMNLIINAGHALLGREEKVITLATGEEAGRLFLRVSDTGCGIPAADLPQIFTPFFSSKGEHAVGETPQAAVRGTGLGLSVCHTIVQQHDGEIAVESEVGRGTTFTVYLPVVQAEDAPPTQPAADLLARWGGRRVLVVDDEADVCELIRLVLERAGLEVVLAHNGKVGLEALRQEAPDLVMVDLQMPIMDGGEFLQALKAEKHRVPVLVMTGRRRPGVNDRLVETRADAFLAKPFGYQELLRQVTALLAQQAQS